MEVDFEVVILGAGPAGCATALAAIQAGVTRVAIIDAPQRKAFSIGESAAPDVSAKLRQLGLNNSLSDRGHTPYHANLSLWAGQEKIDDFLHRASGCGWHLNRERFDEDLRNAAREEGVRLLCPATLQGLEYRNEQWQLQIGYDGNKTHICSQFIVDASGRSAYIAKRLGAKRNRVDNLVALAYLLPTAGGLQGTTLVESTPNGWWYATGLPKQGTVISFMSDADLVQQNSWRSPNEFQNLLQQTECLKQKIPTPNTVAKAPYAFAAYSAYLTQAAGPAWLAVGDALAAFDPLTSSGISNALGDGLAAAPVITHWLNHRTLDMAEHYASRANTGIARYLKERQHQYTIEKRWPDDTFWARRHQFSNA